MKNKRDIISTAFAHEIALLINGVSDSEKKLLPNRFIEFYSNKINPNSIPDKEIISNKDMHSHINWNSMDRKKVIRILARDIELIEKFDLYKYNFEVIEWYPIFLQHPNLVYDVNIDFNNLKTSEAILLLECDQDLIDKIDIFNYNFNKTDMLKIIKKFKFSEKIMNKLNLKSLDHFNMRSLICETGSAYVDNLDLKKLKANDWIDILEKKPEMVEYCDEKIFIKNDCFLLTKFVVLFPDYDYLIHENLKKISGIGWEHLIINDLERYDDICKWDKLSESSWDNIIRYHPELKSEKQKYFLF